MISATACAGDTSESRMWAVAVRTGNLTLYFLASPTTTPAVLTPSAIWLLLSRISWSCSPLPSLTPTDLYCNDDAQFVGRSCILDVWEVLETMTSLTSNRQRRPKTLSDTAKEAMETSTVKKTTFVGRKAGWLLWSARNLRDSGAWVVKMVDKKANGS